MLVLVDEPQQPQNVREQNLARVLHNEPQNEDPVVTEVLVSEALGQLLVHLSVEGVHLLQVLLHEPASVVLDQRQPQPQEQVPGGHRGDEEEPEPEEDEDFLVEQVVRQDTLDRLAVDVVQLAVVEVAQGDLGKALRLRPLMLRGEAGHDLETVQAVPASEECVQQEELTDYVDDVEKFHHDVQTHQVRPGAFLTQETAQLGETLAQAHHAVPVVLSVHLQPPVDVLGYVLRNFFPFLRRTHLLLGNDANYLLQTNAGVRV